MSRLRKVLYAVMLCVILGMAGITAQADEDALDFSRDGNSSIEVIVELKSPVKGALISLYQLQSYDAEHGFVWNAEYENCDISLDGLSASELAQVAKQLENYIKANKISGTQQTTDADGRIVFGNLGFGLYLAVWDGKPQNIKAISPVLLSVPIEDEDGFRYDITIRPKVEKKKENSAEPSSEPSSSKDPDPAPVHPVKKPEPSSVVEEQTEEEPMIETSSIDTTNIDDDTAKGNRKFPQTGPERWQIFLLAGTGIGIFAIGVFLGWRKAGKRLWLSGVLMGAGVVCLFVSGFNIYTEYRQEQKTTELTDEILQQYEKQYFEKSQEATFEEEPSCIEIEGELYGGVLSIPSLGITLPVNMELTYENLRKSPCRYTGSVQEDTMVIAAHNYATHFGNISHLKAGDEVSYVDSDGQEYHYEVSDSEILGAYDIEKMDEGDWDLTLFTCTYGGTSRVAVRCKKINS